MSARRSVSTDALFQMAREWAAIFCPGRTITSLALRFSDGEKATVPVPVSVLSAQPAPDDSPRDCEVDILDLLEEVGHRMTTVRILRELESRDQIHGESTVKTTLSRLCREGKVTNRTDTNPRGYGLPDWPGE